MMLLLSIVLLYCRLGSAMSSKIRQYDIAAIDMNTNPKLPYRCNKIPPKKKERDDENNYNYDGMYVCIYVEVIITVYASVTC